MFFFEKKNQKTFVPCRALAGKNRAGNKNFLLLFFQKSRPFFLLFLCAFAPCGTAVIPNMIGQGAPSAVTSLNPLVDGSTANMEMTNMLFRPLVWIGQDGLMDPARSLVATLTPLDGNTRIRLVLKPWHWSDGVPISSDDVVYTFALIRQLGPLFSFAGQGGIQDRVVDVRAVDAGTVDVKLNGPVNPSWFALNGLAIVAPVPHHAWGDMSTTQLWQRATDPAMARVVDGPFLLTDYKLDEYAAYRPNPRYDGPPAHLARLVVTFMEGGDPMAILRSHAWDMAQVPTALLAANSTIPGFTPIDIQEPFGILAAVLNYRNPKTSFLHDARVRRAMSDAADQQTMIDLVYQHHAHENRAPVPVVPGLWRSPAIQAGKLGVRSDKNLARAELDSAGWHPGPDGIRVKDGQRLAFSATVAADQPERMLLLQLWKSDLRQVGIDVTIRLADTAKVLTLNTCHCDSWDMLVLGLTMNGVPDGSGVFDDGGYLGGGYSDPKLNKLIAESDDTADLKALFDYEDYLAQEQVAIVLPQSGFRLQVANRLAGVENFLNPQGFLAPEELWVRDEGCGTAAGGTGR